MRAYSFADNGWFCSLSPTGRFAAFGNCQVRIVDLETGRVLALPNPPEWEGGGGPGARWQAGWLSDEIVGVVTQGPGNTRALHFVNAFTGAETPTRFPGWLTGGLCAGGTVMQFVPGSWIREIVGDDWDTVHVFREGQSVMPDDRPVFGPFSFTGKHYSYRIGQGPLWPSAIREVDTNALVRVIHCPGDWRWFEQTQTDPQGRAWHVSTFQGRMLVNTPDGEDIVGPAGEGRGCLSWRNGELRVWSVTFAGERAVIIGRTLEAFRVGGPGLIMLDVWQCNLEVVPTRDGYRLAGYNGGGSIGVRAGTFTTDVLPYDATERLLADVVERLTPAAPPVPPPVTPSPPSPVYPPPPDPASLPVRDMTAELLGATVHLDLSYQAPPPPPPTPKLTTSQIVTAVLTLGLSRLLARLRQPR